MKTHKVVFVGGESHGVCHPAVTETFLFENRLLKENGFTYQLQSFVDSTTDREFYFYMALGASGH